MKELVEVIARALVDNPDHVAVTETVKDDEIVLELTVEPSDMGKVIGKQGRIAKAIRSVVKAAASKEDKKVTFFVLDEKHKLRARPRKETLRLSLIHISEPTRPY